MTRIFFDSSALFAAILSSRGAARELMRRHMRGELTLVISEDVIEETTRNLDRKAPEYVWVLERIIIDTHFEIVARPSWEQVREAEEYVEAKDAFIVAAVYVFRIFETVGAAE